MSIKLVTNQRIAETSSKWQQTFHGKTKSFLSAGKKRAHIALRKAALHFSHL